MIANTRQAIRAFTDLPVETNLIAVDENENEYVIDSIIKRKIHSDDDKEWCYALKIRFAGDGCIKK